MNENESSPEILPIVEDNIAEKGNDNIDDHYFNNNNNNNDNDNNDNNNHACSTLSTYDEKYELARQSFLAAEASNNLGLHKYPSGSAMPIMTNRTDGAEIEVKYIREYHRLWGWIGFGIVLLFLLALNLPFIILTAQKHSTSVLAQLAEFNSEYQFLVTQAELLKLQENNGTLTEAQNATLGNTTKESLEISFQQYEQEFEDFQHAMSDIWDYWLSIGLVHLTIYFLLIGYVYHRRKNNLVKGKSKTFLIHLCISAPLAIVLGTLQKGNLYNQYYLSLQNTIWVGGLLGCLTFFAVQSFFSALVCRMRFIYIVFNSKRTMTSEPYFKLIPIHVVLYIISVIPYILHHATDIDFYVEEFNMALLPLLFVFFVVYPVWIIYYTYKCRKLSERYNDFYTNLRICVYFSAIGVLLLIFLILNSDSIVAGALFQFAFQTTALLYIADLVWCILFIDYQKKNHISQRTSSGTNYTMNRNTQNSAVTKMSTDYVLDSDKNPNKSKGTLSSVAGESRIDPRTTKSTKEDDLKEMDITLEENIDLEAMPHLSV